MLSPPLPFFRASTVVLAAVTLAATVLTILTLAGSASAGGATSDGARSTSPPPMYRTGLGHVSCSPGLDGWLPA